MHTTALYPFAFNAAKKSGILPSVNPNTPASATSRDRFGYQVRFGGKSTYTSQASGSTINGMLLSWDSTAQPSHTQEFSFVSAAPTSAETISIAGRKKVLKRCLQYIADKTAGQNAGIADISECTDIINQEFKFKGMKEIAPSTVLGILSDQSLQDKAFKDEMNRQILAAFKQYAGYLEANPGLGEVKRYHLRDLWNQNCKKLGLKDIPKEKFYRLLTKVQDKRPGERSADIQVNGAHSFSHQAEGSNSSYTSDERTISAPLSRASFSTVNPSVTLSENGSSSIAAMTPMLELTNWQTTDQPFSGLEVNPFEDVFIASNRHSGHMPTPSQQIFPHLSHQVSDLTEWANYMARIKCIGSHKDYRKAEEELDNYLLEHYSENPAVQKVRVVTMAQQLLPFAHQQVQPQFHLSEEIMPPPMENAFGLDLSADSSNMLPLMMPDMEQLVQEQPAVHSESQVSPEDEPSSATVESSAGSSASAPISLPSDSPLPIPASPGRKRRRAEKQPIRQDIDSHQSSQQGSTVKPLDLVSLKKFAKPNDEYEGVFLKKLLRTLVEKLGFSEKRPDDLNDIYLDSDSIYSHLDEDDTFAVSDMLHLPEGAPHSQKRYFEGLKKKLPSLTLSNKRHRAENS